MSDKKTKDWRKYFNKSNYIRIIELSNTPDLDEFSKNAILVTTSVILAGFLGYIIFLIMTQIPMT